MVDKHVDPSFGRDGISGMVSRDGALRARELDPPRVEPVTVPLRQPPPVDPGPLVLRGLLARASGRVSISRRSDPPSGSA